MNHRTQSNDNLKGAEKTPQAENLFKVLFQSSRKQQNIINLPQFQWQLVVKNATKERKSLDEEAQVSRES